MRCIKVKKGEGDKHIIQTKGVDHHCPANRSEDTRLGRIGNLDLTHRLIFGKLQTVESPRFSSPCPGAK
jgi:hypothetical protein